MRVHATDQLFGLEAFSRPIQKDLPENPAEPAGTVAAEMNDSPSDSCPPVISCGITAGPDAEPGAEPASLSEDLSLPGEFTIPVMALRSLISRKVVLSLALFVLCSAVGLSLFTLVMKTRKKAVSYELAHQTKLFKRMSKHRAIYELEYAYLRTSSPVLEEFAREGWREITPHDLTYIPMKKPVAAQPGGLSW